MAWIRDYSVNQMFWTNWIPKYFAIQIPTVQYRLIRETDKNPDYLVPSIKKIRWLKNQAMSDFRTWFKTPFKIQSIWLAKLDFFSIQIFTVQCDPNNEHFYKGNIRIMNFYLIAIQMPGNR